MTPATIAFVTGAPHAEEAVAFVEWMLAARVEAWLAASRSGNAPIADPEGARATNIGADWPAGLERGDAYRCSPAEGVAVIDWDGAARHGDAALQRFMAAVRRDR